MEKARKVLGSRLTTLLAVFVALAPMLAQILEGNYPGTGEVVSAVAAIIAGAGRGIEPGQWGRLAIAIATILAAGKQATPPAQPPEEQ